MKSEDIHSLFSFRGHAGRGLCSAVNRIAAMVLLASPLAVQAATVIPVTNGDLQADPAIWATTRFAANQWYRSSGSIQAGNYGGTAPHRAAGFLANSSNLFMETKVGYSLKNEYETYEYTLELYLYKASNANFTSVSVSVGAIHPSLNTVVSQSIDILAVDMPALEWTRYEVTFTDTAPATHLNWNPYIRVQIPGASTTGLYVDNVSLTVEGVPEPGPSLLVGAGAILMLARRKRARMG